MKSRYKHPLTRRIFIACLIFVFILSLVMGLVSFFIFRSRMLDQFEEHLRDIINLTAARIDVEDLDECIRTGEESEKFQELTEFVDQVRQNYELDSIVLSKPVKEGDRYDMIQVVAGLYPEERAGQKLKEIDIPLLGDRMGDAFPPEFLPIVYEQLQNCPEIEFSTSSSEFGSSYNGALGIYKEDGTPVALLTAGLSLSFIDTTMQQYVLLMLLLTVVLSLVFALIMLIWFRKRVTKPLGEIERAARAFDERTKTEQDPRKLLLALPEIRSGDELESLADTLSSMSLSTKKYVEDLIRSAVKMGHLEKDLDQSIKNATKLSELATKDALTGIRNKTAYDEEVEKTIWDLNAGNMKFGVVMVDLNFLKRINDTFGHEKGNVAIKKLCHLVCDTFQHSPVFRIGGDEFAVIIKGNDYEEIENLVGRFLAEIEKAQEDSSLQPWERTSAAIGYALYDETIDSGYDNVFRRADKAMYEMKKKMKALR